MIDARLRPWIDPLLNGAGKWLASRGITADAMTFAGFGTGILAALAIALGHFHAGLALIVVNRLADGLDGAVARATKPSDRGGFLDISLDFAFYAAIPLAFAVQDPAANALAAACLSASFLANGAAFLAYAVIAGNRGQTSTAQGRKSIYYVAGLAEGAETIAVFIVLCLWPCGFAILAFAFAALCALSAAARIVLGWYAFAD